MTFLQDSVLYRNKLAHNSSPKVPYFSDILDLKLKTGCGIFYLTGGAENMFLKEHLIRQKEGCVFSLFTFGDCKN